LYKKAQIEIKEMAQFYTLRKEKNKAKQSGDDIFSDRSLKLEQFLTTV